MSKPAIDIFDNVLTVLSFVCFMGSIFVGEEKVLAYILFSVAFLSFGFLTLHLKVEQSKTYTLQVLASENRMASIRLLLTHERLKHSNYEYTERFFPSKLYIQNAYYSYRVLPSNYSAERCDIEYTQKFQLKKVAPKNGSFDILISQSKGTAPTTINYKFSEDGEEYTTSLEEIVCEKDKNILPGLWKAKISWDSSDNVQTLIVSYTLKQIYRIGENMVGAFLICPFIYGKKVEKLNVEFNFQNNSIHAPKIVSLKLYPFNGKKCPPQKIHDLLPSNNNSLWKIQQLRCITNGMYILEVYR